jgi:hypothetical protein
MLAFNKLMPYLNSPDRFIVAMVAVIVVWIAFDRYRG